MYSISFEWKNFSVNLTTLDAWLRANAGPHYAGNSADIKLTLWFTEDPGPAVVTACEQYWDAIDVNSTEATTYVSSQAVKDAVAGLKVDLHTKTWAAMSTAERKIVIGQTPTNAELGL